MQLTMKQSISFRPKLQQAVKLLQLSAQELDAEVQAALETNPLLEINDDLHDNTFEFSDADTTYDATINLHHTPDLQEYLLWQLNLTPLNQHDHVIAVNLLDSINEDGYLCADLNEILQSLKAQHAAMFAQSTLADLEAVLGKIQQFDPAGVGARTLSECMLLQLQTLQLDKKSGELCKKLILEHLNLLAKKDYLALKRHLLVNDNELSTIIQQIKRLNPRPGLIFAPNKTEYIIPDVIAEKIHGIWNITLNQSNMSKLRINANYVQLMRQAKNAHDSSALRKQFNEARWLIDSIQARNMTLLKVTNFIVQHQADFLEHGEEKMRPLKLQEISVALGLSESTISRITTKKYLHTPRGTFELKFFFSGNFAANNIQGCSAVAIKAIIKQIIREEPAQHRYSDQELTDLIAKRGIIIARRTVTKYRESLGIRASHQRGI